MAIENPNLPPQPPTTSNQTLISTPMQSNPQNQRRSRPRVREVSSRFMSPVTKSPSINAKQVPSTPIESQISRNNSLRRSNTDFRSRFDDENRNYQINRSSVSPVRSRPRAAVKLFRDGSRPDTPVVPVQGLRVVRQRSFDTAAAKLLQAGGGTPDSDDDDNVSVKSEPIDHGDSKNCSGNSNCLRVLTPSSRSMELNFGRNERHETGGGGGGGNVSKVVRSLNLPPMPPGPGCSRPQGMVEGKKTVMRKGGSSQVDDVWRVKLLQNHYLQWRFANAKAEACLKAQEKSSERQLYSMALKISELQDSVKNKRFEVRSLKEAQALSKVLETQMPGLDEWSALEEAYSSSLLELIQGLQSISSRLPLVGNVKADVKEINEAMNSALKVAESISLQVQGFVPKAEQVDGLISDLASVHNGELALVQECGVLLSKTHLSQIEECSLRGQLIQSTNANLMSKQDQT